MTQNTSFVTKDANNACITVGLGNISIYHQYREITCRSCNNDITDIFTSQ